jgi:hypothetical protein
MSDHNHLPMLCHVLRSYQLLLAQIWFTLLLETCAREQISVFVKRVAISSTFFKMKKIIYGKCH